MFDPFYLLVPFIIIALITVLVAAHELGHYLFARLFGMGVEEFAIGFGKKPIWTWMKKTYRVDPSQGTRPSNAESEDSIPPEVPATETTNFTFRAWPLGGFVRIKGMLPEEDGSEVHIPGGFYSKAPWQRFVVLLMGPVFSILAGFALLVPLFMIIGGKGLNEARISGVTKDSPAMKAGMRAGDRITAIDGKPVKTWYDLVSKVRDHGAEPVNFEILRGSERLKVAVTPILSPEKSPVLDDKLKPTKDIRRQWIIGAKQVILPISFGEAISIAAAMPVKMVESLAGVARNPSTFKDQMGGPVSIVRMAAEQARAGIAELISFAGMLSISLGIFNLLPIAPLDGGQMVVAVVEMFRKGRRLSFRVQNWVAGVGILLIFALVIGVLAADISRFFPEKQDEKSVQTGTK